MLAWILSKLTAQIALPIMGILLLTNIASGIGLAITRHTLADRTAELAAETKAHLADVATFKAATAQAEADDKAHQIAVKQQEDQISAEKQNDLEKQIADARSVAAKWVQSHGAPTANHGSITGASMPSTSNTSSGPDITPAYVVVPASDIDACAVIKTVAEGWQTWWAKEYPIMLSGAGPQASMATDRAIIPITSMGASIGRDDTGMLVAPVEPASLVKPLVMSDSGTENISDGKTDEDHKGNN